MKFTKVNIALFIALLFHVSGTIGILFTTYKNWFIENTALNLCLMAVLLIYTQEQKNKAFFLFAFIAFAIGMITEIIGVNTGYLFGNYSYGTVMGYKVLGVPLLIGVQWFVTVYCCGIVMHQLHNWIENKYAAQGVLLSPRVQTLSLIIDGALLATLFDFIMEPVAIQLDFWEWQNNQIPLLNYACWFGISLFLLWIFKLLPIVKHNHFALHLLIVQILFFLILRAYL